MSATIQTVHQPQQFYVGMTLQDQRRQFVTNRLKENFPRTFNFTYATIMLLGGVVGIILEVVILGNATYYTSVTGGGIWGGVTGIICGAIAFLFDCKRTYGFYLGNVLTQSFGATILFTAYTVLNISNVAGYSSCYYRCNYYYGAIGANIALLVIGTILLILACVYMSKLNYSITGSFGSNALYGAIPTVIVAQPAPYPQGQVGPYGQPQMNQFGQAVYGQPQMNQFGQPSYGQPQMNQFGQPMYGQPQMNQYSQPGAQPNPYAAPPSYDSDKNPAKM